MQLQRKTAKKNVQYYDIRTSNLVTPFISHRFLLLLL